MLLTVLVFILMTTLAASGLVVAHATQMQREREAELLFIGAQFRRAIASYYNTMPAGRPRALPQSLDDLLNDHRFPTPIQHLRRIYPDPMTGKADWEIVRDGDGVVGVHSRSTREPLKRKGFGEGYEHFEDKQSYAEWVFTIRQR